MTPLGKNTGKLAPGFSWTCPHEPFPLADFYLYPFTIINCNHEYNNFTESCKPYQEIMDTEGGLGDPQQQTATTTKTTHTHTSQITDSRNKRIVRNYSDNLK